MHSLFSVNSRKIVSQTIRHIAVDGCKVLLTLAVIEGTIRTVAPQYIHNIFDQEFTGGHPINVNEDGFRSERLPIDKPEGEFRILALGDSTTFGTGVSREATWSSQLVDLLREQYPQTHQLNAGQPTRDLPTLNKGYLELWSRYDPNVVILAVSNNMVSFGWINQDKEPSLPTNKYLPERASSPFKRLTIQIKRVYKNFALVSWLSINSQRIFYILGLNNHQISPQEPFGPILAFGWKQADVDPELSGKAWVQFEHDLAILRDSILEDKRKFIVVYMPSRFMVFDDIFDNEKFVPRQRIAIDPAQKLAEICDELNIPYLSGVQPLQSGRQHIAKEEKQYDPMYILFDYMHLDPAGHQAIAHALANQFTPLAPNNVSQSNTPDKSRKSL
ncbi:MAG: hypothetical protein QNJ46_00370 [Leptolyngbyaceae cyanobacterium MO_188.B28]|nr:hypothetical protein [Leptolyngbyaceae cyanobacterium MO_188.B28]